MRRDYNIIMIMKIIVHYQCYNDNDINKFNNNGNNIYI